MLLLLAPADRKTKPKIKPPASGTEILGNVGAVAGIASFIGYSVVEPRPITRVVKEHPSVMESFAVVTLLWILAVKSRRIRAVFFSYIKSIYDFIFVYKITMPGIVVLLLLAIGYLTSLVVMYVGGKGDSGDVAPNTPVVTGNQPLVTFGQINPETANIGGSSAKADALKLSQQKPVAPASQGYQSAQSAPLELHHISHKLSRSICRRHSNNSYSNRCVTVGVNGELY